jgi:nucleoside diphosphate kinase
MKHLAQTVHESMNKSKVFVVLKPGSLDLAQTVIERFAQDGWKVSQTITKKLLLTEARNLYKVHRKEDFYKDLCEYMCSDICRAFIFEKSNVLDPFEEVKRIKDEIREKYGESDMRNVLHSSDSQEAMDNEACVFFGCW